jgi:hypothetical protein
MKMWQNGGIGYLGVRAVLGDFGFVWRWKKLLKVKSLDLEGTEERNE